MYADMRSHSVANQHRYSYGWSNWSVLVGGISISLFTYSSTVNIIQMFTQYGLACYV